VLALISALTAALTIEARSPQGKSYREKRRSHSCGT
jgi:hypothetical protein